MSQPVAAAMRHEDKKRLTEILARYAITNPAGVQAYFRNLVVGANLPDPYKQQRAGGWSGDARTDALDLVDYALARSINPQDGRYTTLGSILEPQIDLLGFDDAGSVAALIVGYGLFLDPKLLNPIASKFQVPRMGAAAGAGVQMGPDIKWCGPDSDIELQSWLREEPNLLDVGFLMDAVKSSRSVCRVEVGAGGQRGTGVLIDKDLVLSRDGGVERRDRTGREEHQIEIRRLHARGRQARNRADHCVGSGGAGRCVESYA
jgi:Effector-associated domain 8